MLQRDEIIINDGVMTVKGVLSKLSNTFPFSVGVAELYERIHDNGMEFSRKAIKLVPDGF